VLVTQSIVPTCQRWLAAITIASIVAVPALACKGAVTHQEKAPSSSTPSTAPVASSPVRSSDPAANPVPLQDLETAQVLQLNQTWKGDFDRIASGERRFIRALVPVSRTFYYADGPEQRGVAFEALREFEKVLGESGKGNVKPKVVIIPTSRDRLLPALAEGLGEIAVGGFTVTEARKHAVDFSEPTLQNIRHIVVAGPGVPKLTSLDDLAGREVHVRRSSSYYEDLTALNARFKSEGKDAIKIVPVDEVLEDEDVLQMVDADILPITITKTLYASFWRQVYDQIHVYDNLTVRDGASLAWAIRRDTPQLKKVVNDFVRTHRAGTTFGNVIIKRYLGSASRLKNPAAEADLKRFRSAAASFRKYAGQYDFDWLVIAAQAYQESRIDQSLKSSAGAVGVMQIKPATAAEVGVPNVDDLDSNIHAGVKYVRFLVDRYYKDEPMDRLNRGLFAFASYNAGPAKVRRMRAKAKEIGLNPNIWFNNVELVAGEVIGRETVDYVSNIYKYYTAYKAITAQRELRGRRAAAAPMAVTQ
jgi:membrane-bound lytic murein transglycosylase MltF